MILENYSILMILVDFFWFRNTIKIVEFYDFCFLGSSDFLILTFLQLVLHKLS